MVTPPTEIIKQLNWKLSSLDEYRRTNYFKLTPSFLFSEFISRKNREKHFREFNEYKDKMKIASLSPQDLFDMEDSRNFSNLHFKELPDLRRFPLMELAISNARINGVIAEFGVFRAESLNYIASRYAQKVHGFDSFQGLPEDWNLDHKKGHFALENSKLPNVRKNVELHVGMFADTVPAFAKVIGNVPLSFLHVDCDLYSSTSEIFRNLENNIVPGTVILFDEYYNYPGWRNHEFLAFKEFVERTGLDFNYIGYNSKWQQAAVIIK